MNIHDLIAGIVTGLAGGLTAGLLGVSPGGGLVVFSVLLLGAGQHVAQGISLVAQVPPTSLTGIRRYWKGGNRTPLRWIVLLTFGFVAGGAAGALAANHVAEPALRWTYVAYLVALDAMLILRGGRDTKEHEADGAAREISWPALLIVGLLAGLSSGFLGIGGGLATVVGLSAVLGVPQHQAQKPCDVADPDDNPVGLDLLERGRARVMAGAGRRDRRPARRHRSRRPRRQPHRPRDATDRDDLLRVADGGLYDVQGAVVELERSSLRRP